MPTEVARLEEGIEKSTSPQIDYAQPSTESPSRESFGARSARGGIILTVAQFFTAFLIFSSQIVLGWLLAPDVFGVMAAAVSLAGVVGIMRDAGAIGILIDRQKQFDKIASTVYWLTLTAASACGLIVAIAAPIVAHLKGNPLLVPVLLLTALRFPFGAFGTVSGVKLQLDLRWARFALVTFLLPLVTSVVSIVMAWRGFGVYSLVIPPILGEAVRGVAAWTLSGSRPLGKPDLSIAREILHSSTFIIATNLLLALRSFGDYLTLSFTRSERETGLYYYAFVMSQGMSRLTVGAAMGVVTPVIAKVKHDKARHAQVLTQAMHTLAILSTPPIVLQILLGGPLFRVFLNAKWAGAAILFSVMSFAIVISFLNNLVSQALTANGMFKQYFQYLLVTTPVWIALFVGGSFVAGALGVSWGLVIASALELTFLPLYGFRLLEVPWAPAMLPLWRPVVASLPAVAAALLINPWLPMTRSGDVARMGIVLAVGTLTYIPLLWLIWRPGVTLVWGYISRALGIAKD